MHIFSLAKVMENGDDWHPARIVVHKGPEFNKQAYH